MKFHAALVLLMGLASAYGQELTTNTYWTPAPPKTPAPPPKTPAPPPQTPAPPPKTPAPGPPTTPAPPPKTPAPGPPTTPAPPGPTPTKPGGTGDPVMTGLDGRSFEFFGQVGKVYNVLSEKNHQLSMKLKAGKMWDHEGSYMEAIGFKYMDHTVAIAESANGLEVTLDGEALAMRKSQTEQEVILGLAEGEMQLLWQLHRADYGNAVEITTDLLQIVAWVTPAGTRDEGGKVQPAYLNFDLTLLATPAHNTLEGILGQSYAAAGVAAEAENDFKFHGEESAYEMASLFDTAHPKSIFGKASGGKARKLMEGTVTFPMRATTRGFAPVSRAAGRGLIAGRKQLA